MKRNTLPTTLLLFVLLLFVATAQPCLGGEIVVTPGSPRSGEEISAALRQAREWRRIADPRAEGGITIRLRAGLYRLSEPLLLRPEDSGTEASPTVIAGDEGATICGDTMQRHTQLWPVEGMERIVDFDAAARTITIATPPRELSASDGLEMVVHQRWAIAILRVLSIESRGGLSVVRFREPESRLEFEHPWPQPVVGGERGSSSYLLRTTEQRRGLEQLLVADGVEWVRIEGITFENTCWNRPLERGHVTLQGGFPLIDAYKLASEGLPWDATLENQAWIERPVAAVSMRNVSDVAVSGCTFRRLGATALDIETAERATVSHCTFTDIGGTAIMAGPFAESPREVHRPYDYSGFCHHVTIADNTILRAATEDWGAVGIGCGYVSNLTVSRNRVSHVNYSAICVGWGWTALPTGMHSNVIEHNTISHYAMQLYDAGGIYTLSSQPGSAIRGNVVSLPHPAPYATNSRAFAIYLDARTDGYTIEDNHTDTGLAFGQSEESDMRRFGRPLIGFNHPGPDIIIKQ